MHRLIRLVVVLALGAAACSPGGGTSATGRDGNAEKFPPCHPGCFPAGTLVETPAGPRPIESVRADDSVLLVGPDGAATAGPVQAVFRTTNVLVEVRTEAGNLRTTETQPLARVSGGFRPAGELAPGDLVWRWVGGQRQPALVTAVVATGRVDEVYNLVVGDGLAFVAGGFVARGKPPATGAEPGP